MLQVQVRYRADRPYWAVLADGEPVALYPCTASGYMRAVALILA